MQDEINHRRSKALHLLSQRQTLSRKGAVKDVGALKRELAKPDGHIEVQGDKNDFEVLPTGDMAKGQFELLQEAKSEIDAQSFNAQLAGQRQAGDLSGVAVQKLQQAGVTELNNLFSALNGWERRVYRQIWARIKQFWTDEKWIRVTDDQDSLRWVGLNAQVTAQQWLQETSQDKSLPLQKQQQAAAALQALTQQAQGQDPGQAQAAQAQLQTIVNIKNSVPELDVDIILDQSFDVVNIQQEQFELLAQLAQNPNSGIDPIELIRVSQIRGKEEMIDRIQQQRAQQQQVQQQALILKAQQMQAETAKATSQAQLNQASAAERASPSTPRRLCRARRRPHPSARVERSERRERPGWNLTRYRSSAAPPSAGSRPVDAEPVPRSCCARAPGTTQASHPRWASRRQ